MGGKSKGAGKRKPVLAEIGQLSHAVKTFLDEREWPQARLVEQAGVSKRQLSKLITDQAECGVMTLRALGPMFPAEVAAVVRVAPPETPRPLWPNLAELLAQMQGTISPADEGFLRRLNHLWPADRPGEHWYRDLQEHRALREQATQAG